MHNYDLLCLAALSNLFFNRKSKSTHHERD